MFDIRSLFVENHPGFARQHPLLTSMIVNTARFLWKEKEFKAFAVRHEGKQGVQLIEEGFRQINFDFSITPQDLARIPVTGPVVMVANHPVGYLDGIGLLKVMAAVRPDIRLMVNASLHEMLGMKDMTIPVDNFNGAITRQSLKIIKEHLEGGGMLIIFPSGMVSRRVGGETVDMPWNPSFLRFARQYAAPVVPVYIHASNSRLFYVLAVLVAPLARRFLMVRELLQMKLIREMFSRHCNTRAPMLVGEPMDAAALEASHPEAAAQAEAVRQALYGLRQRLA